MKAFKRAIALTLVLACMMSMVACGEKGIVGKWVDSTLAVENTIELNKDGTGKMGAEGVLSFDFTYTYTDDKLTVTILGQNVVYDYKLDGDTLTLVTEGQTEVFKRK